MPDLTDRERIAALEVEMRHALSKLDETNSLVKEMHEIILQLRGAKWGAFAVAAFFGAIGGKTAAFLSGWLGLFK